MTLINRLYYAAGSDRLKEDWRTRKLLEEAARALSCSLSAEKLHPETYALSVIGKAKKLIEKGKTRNE